MQKELLSVIIPAYNCEKSIVRCIESLKSQSYVNIEVLIIDDGSTDNTVENASSAIANDNRFKIISKHNGGVSCARNHGLSKATGRYVAFVDSDDWVEPKIYTTLIDKLEQTDSQLAVCGQKIFHKQSEKVVLPQIEQDIITFDPSKSYNFVVRALINNTMYSECMQSVWNKVYYRDIIFSNNISFDPNLAFAEDWLFNLEYISKCTGISITHQALYNYDLTTENSLSKKYRPDGVNCSIYIRKRISRLFPEECDGDSYYAKLFSIERHYLNHNARLYGFNALIDTANSLWVNFDMKEAANQANHLRQNSLLRLSRRTNCKSLYVTSAILFAGGGVIKYYVSKLFNL